MLCLFLLQRENEEKQVDSDKVPEMQRLNAYFDIVSSDFLMPLHKKPDRDAQP
jgi:hypothetical protein